MGLVVVGQMTHVKKVLAMCEVTLHSHGSSQLHATRTFSHFVTPKGTDKCLPAEKLEKTDPPCATIERVFLLPRYSARSRAGVVAELVTGAREDHPTHRLSPEWKTQSIPEWGVRVFFSSFTSLAAMVAAPFSGRLCLCSVRFLFFWMILDLPRFT